MAPHVRAVMEQLAEAFGVFQSKTAVPLAPATLLHASVGNLSIAYLFASP